MISIPYIAGFFDGEGNVRISQTGKWGSGPRACIAQSGDRGKEILSKIQAFLIPFEIKTGIDSQEPTKFSKETLYRLTVDGRENVLRFLRLLLPYLEVKRVETENIIRHYKIFPPLARGGVLTWESRLANQKAA